MFSLAVWDRERRCLLLGRDRFGEKPLYLFRHGRGLAFASEVGALKRHPSWRGEINEDAVARYFRNGHVPGIETIYEGVTRLAPGHYLEIDGGGETSRGPRTFWSLSGLVESVRPRAEATPQALLAELEARLDEVVNERMLSDVPLGVLLSGGIDSSAIAAAAQVRSDKDVRTFSVGFGEAAHDESGFAAEVANHLGTNHTRLHLDPDEALEFIPQIPDIWGEPFADASQIPTALISRKAREHVTVCLAGDGGDELFGGYTRYNAGVSLWQAGRLLPWSVRNGIAQALRWSAEHGCHGSSPGQVGSRFSRVSERAGKLATCFEAADRSALYDRLTATWENSQAPSLVTGVHQSAPWWGEVPQHLDAREYMMFRDLVGYLPDDLLVKTDRASMASSLEVRLPFLDSRLVKFAWEVPRHYKIRRGKGKWLLRELVNRRLPKQLMDRPKQGFTVPVGEWLRGPLRSWAEDLLAPERIRAEGWLDAIEVKRLWERHLAGASGCGQQLWTVLMFQAWLASNSQSGTCLLEQEPIQP